MHPLVDLCFDFIFRNVGPKWLQWISAIFLTWSIAAAFVWLMS
ncbi:hypothetical protein [Qipengyuania proteolytica]|nr:hypothetical protein [Qipengyuania proteolytica]